MKLEIHLIQSFGPSCLNRDATNSPKDCEFGGVRRARISSQCFKRAIRGYFREHNLVPVGERTKRLRAELMPLVQDFEPEESQELLEHGVDAFLDTYYSQNDSKKREQSAVLLFLSRCEMEIIAQCIRDAWGAENSLKTVAADRAKAVEKVLANSKSGRRAGASKDGMAASNEPAPGEEGTGEGTSGSGGFKNLPGPKWDKNVAAILENAAISADIALFGRMLAEHTEFKVEAAAQVAHAISTHAVNADLDFFSAVDDLNKDDAGAGMLGETGFNAACFYRYALVDIGALESSLKDREAALNTARAFMEAFVSAVPTGRQNSMAAQNRPSFGLFVVRDGGEPCSLSNAFCTPVRLDAKEPSDGIIDLSVQKLAKHWQRHMTVYGNVGVVATSVFSLVDDDYLHDLSKKNAGSVRATIEGVMTALQGGGAA